MDRIVTGITGLDDLIGGGIPEGSTILLTGSCGTGKSILSLQYIYNGAMSGEPGLYVTFEETKEKIIEHSKKFNMDIRPLEDKGMMEGADPEVVSQRALESQTPVADGGSALRRGETFSAER